MPGFSELVFFLIVVMFVFAAGKMPAIANTLSKRFLKLRNRAAQATGAADDLGDDDEDDGDDDEDDGDVDEDDDDDV